MSATAPRTGLRRPLTGAALLAALLALASCSSGQFGFLWPEKEDAETVASAPPPPEPMPEPAPAPVTVSAEPETMEPTGPPPAPRLKPANLIAVVAGDSVSGIALRYGIDTRAIIVLNGLAYPYWLRTGQRLRLPGKDFNVAAYNGQQRAAPTDPPRDAPSQARAGTAASPAQAPADAPREVRTQAPTEIATPSREVAAPYPEAAPPPRETVTAQRSTAQAAPSREASATQRRAGREVPPARKDGTPARAEPPARAAASPPPEPVIRLARAEPQPVPSARPAASEPVPLPPSRNTFLWPIEGRVISKFGSKPGGKHNDGINIAVPVGSDVRAAKNGVVAYAGNELRGYGNLVLIRHEDGWMTAYAHNEALLVEKGDVVRRGQVISRSGKSGRVSRPQAHFEIRRNGEPQDPLGLLTRR